ncbi:SulP family inorganic anion transporter, partial [Escherichia coli]|nr:SulP family inorganic anion transporter [Escherichia coli]
VGNLLCGLAGALPMTGVIVRSSANVQAGAITRMSAVLHGAWLLGFAALLPWLLREIPMAALGGVLVVTGWKLVSVSHVRHLFHHYGML